MLCPFCSHREGRVVDSRESRDGNRDISADEIDEYLMSQLQRLDKVAFIRFALVYRDFQDVRDLVSEVSHLNRE